MKRLVVIAAALFLQSNVAVAQEVPVADDGTIEFPALSVPSSTIMSEEGNRSRIEHILTERSLKGRSVAELNAALFGPRLGFMKAAYPQVSVREDKIAGVRVFIYEPKGIKFGPRNRRALINVHGGGFVGCFEECGGVESIPVAALTGIPVVSIDYRLAPAARFPAASEDVAAVYSEILKGTSSRRVGLYGCSAGGLLTAQSLAWFQSHRLPRPAAAGIFCAGGDPGLAGDSRYTGLVLGDGEAPRQVVGSAPRLGYMAGTSDDDPNAFPGRSPQVLAQYPPTLIITGTRDFGMSSAVNLHSRLVAQGVDARLHVWEGGRHAFFYDVRVPEAREVYAVVSQFFKQRLK